MVESSVTQPEARIIKPPATLLVIFGASGDLTSRKLIPALCNLAEDQYLPENFIVIGSSRSKLSDDEFRAKVYEGIQKYSRRPISPAVWQRFSENLHYQPCNGEVIGTTRRQDVRRSLWRSRSVTTRNPRETSTKFSERVSPRSRSTVSTTTLERRRFRTYSYFASRMVSLSRCGIGSTSITSRYRSVRISVLAIVLRTLMRMVSFGTSCRTTSSRCYRCFVSSLQYPSVTPIVFAMKRRKCCAQLNA